ncbi:hypothetical protein SKAU_G00418410 [Synaphobranchus kaupii]|uniref:Uncharacterized protein n=1 Tax=Synaphobranchus kaupii TaxID=118154 RepID=A0A9Q1E639_SYNKA|nr:hypothetical protein SKAU_G00418410 [Synaphobranchus kaupii]
MLRCVVQFIWQPNLKGGRDGDTYASLQLPNISPEYDVLQISSTQCLWSSLIVRHDWSREIRPHWLPTARSPEQRLGSKDASEYRSSGWILCADSLHIYDPI